MSFPAAQISFGAGELSPEVRARIDISKYGIGATTLKNFFVRVSGGANNRTGFEYVVSNKDDDKVARLIPFQFNIEQTYMLIFQENSIRVIKDGGIVLEGATVITGATQANPVEITAVGHGIATGSEVFISGVGGMTELNEKFFIMTSTGANTLTLNGVDGTAFTAFTTGGTVAKVFDLVTTYADAEIFDIDFTQSNDVMTLVHPSHEPANLNRLADDNWTLTDITIAPGISAPGSVAAVYTGSGTGVTLDYVVTSFNEETGEESIASTPSSVSGDLSVAGDEVTITWATNADATQYNIYKAEDGSGFYGFIGSSNNLTFTDRNITPEFNDSPAITVRDPFSGTDNKPSAVSYFQGRRWFAATNNKPTTAFGTVSGNFTNFNVSKAVRDDDAVTGTLSSQQANAIRYLVPLGQFIVFTSGSEWLLSSSGVSSLITPSSISFNVQGYWGSMSVKPIVVGSAALHITGNIEEDDDNPKFSMVRDIRYTLESDNYTGTELSILASHLFVNKEIVDWDYAQIPFSLVWAVRNDGIMLSMAYVAEADLWAWSQHDTQGKFESVSSVREGGEDAVYVVVRRNIGGVFKRFIERQHTRQFLDIRDWFGVDSGSTYDIPLAITGATQTNPVVLTVTAHGYSNGARVDITDVEGMELLIDDELVSQLNGKRFKIANVATNTFELQTDEDVPVNVDGTTFTAYVTAGKSREAVDTVFFLDHLEGETVVALADGNVLKDLTVTNGSVSLDAFYSRVHVGLPYVCDLETIDANILDKTGIVFDKKRILDGVVLRLNQTRGGFVGSIESNLYEIKWRTNEKFGEPGALSSDEFVQIESSWAFKSHVFYRQSDPLPVTILSVIPDLDGGND